MVQLTKKLNCKTATDVINDFLSYLIQMSPLVAAAATTTINNRPITTGSTNNSSSHQQHSTPPPPPPLHNNNMSGWSATCLRPPPPLRPCLALGLTPNSSSSVCSGRKPTSYREDAMILDVIEAYCSAAKPRNTVNSGRLHKKKTLVSPFTKN